jgi:phage shock protein E
MKNIAWGLAAALASSCALISTSDTPGVEARKLVGAGAQLIDVRSPSEFADGHIEGAVNIPVAELESRLGEVAAKETPIVVYCRSGHRSRRAADVLKAHGWKDVHNLGPKSAW